MPPLSLNARITVAARRKQEDHANPWDECLIQRLEVLWMEGHSTAEIGRRLGITKNAVVGKVRRLQLPPRLNPIHRCAGTGTQRVSTPRPAAEPEPEPATPSHDLHRALVEPPKVLACDRDQPFLTATSTVPTLTPKTEGRQCCWPVGEPGKPDFRFCEAHATLGKPYCAEHVDIAYVRRDTPRHNAV